jgi:hypothetical protein
MASNAASQIARVLAPVLKESGYRRRGLNWYRYGVDSVLLVNVQRARYTSGAYINLGVYYYKYGSMELPKDVDCHLTTRLTALVPNPLREMELLDFAKDIPLETRRAEIKDMMRSYGVSWLDAMADIDSARSVLARDKKAVHVAPIARADLRSTQTSPSN